MFLLWLGDRISLKGIGNGVSIIIFAGIVGRLPGQISSMWTTMIGTGTGGALFSGLLSFALYLFCYLLIIVFVVFMNLAERKIPIQYTSSTVQTRHKDMTYLPLKINSASVIPVIFANALMMAPIQIASFFPANDFINGMNYILGMQNGWSLCVYVVLIILFTFFYTKMQIDPAKIAEKIRHVYPWHPPGQRDEGIYQQGAVPHHRARRHRSGIHRGAAACHSAVYGSAELHGYRRNRNHHRRWCCAGDGKAGGEYDGNKAL